MNMLDIDQTTYTQLELESFYTKYKPLIDAIVREKVGVLYDNGYDFGEKYQYAIDDVLSLFSQKEV